MTKILTLAEYTRHEFKQIYTPVFSKSSRISVAECPMLSGRTEATCFKILSHLGWLSLPAVFWVGLPTSGMVYLPQAWLVCRSEADVPLIFITKFKNNTNAAYITVSVFICPLTVTFILLSCNRVIRL